AQEKHQRPRTAKILPLAKQLAGWPVPKKDLPASGRGDHLAIRGDRHRGQLQASSCKRLELVAGRDVPALNHVAVLNHEECLAGRRKGELIGPRIADAADLEKHVARRVLQDEDRALLAKSVSRKHFAVGRKGKAGSVKDILSSQAADFLPGLGVPKANAVIAADGNQGFAVR